MQAATGINAAVLDFGAARHSFLNIFLRTAHNALQASRQQQHRRSLRVADASAAVPTGLGQWTQAADPSDQKDLAVILGSGSSGTAAATPTTPAPVKISDLLTPPGRKLLTAAVVPAGLAEWLLTATPEQKEQLALLGCDEATLQTATPAQLQQLAQQVGLPDPTAQLPPTLQQLGGMRRLQGADTPPGLTEWAQTAPSTVQDDLTKLGLGAARVESSAVTLQQVAGP